MSRRLRAVAPPDERSDIYAVIDQMVTLMEAVQETTAALAEAIELLDQRIDQLETTINRHHPPSRFLNRS